MSIISESEDIPRMTINHYERILRERDQAREQSAKLLSIAERAIDELRWFYEGGAVGFIFELEELKKQIK